MCPGLDSVTGELNCIWVLWVSGELGEVWVAGTAERGWECWLLWVPFSRRVAWWMLCVPLAVSGRCPWSCLSRATVGFGLPPHPYSAAPSRLSASLHGSVLVCGMVSGAGGLRTVWLPAHRQGEGRGRSSLCASGPSAGGEGGCARGAEAA